jgi:cytochrome c oxidase subunit 4
MKHDSDTSTAETTHHITGIPTYLAVFATLMVLTVITVVVALQNFGVLNTPIALIIATIKASLVIVFFMHARYSSKLVWVILITSVVMMGVLFVLTFSDYLSRSLSHL